MIIERPRVNSRRTGAELGLAPWRPRAEQRQSPLAGRAVHRPRRHAAIQDRLAAVSTQVPETPQTFYTGIQVTPEGVAMWGIEALGLTVTITPAEDTAPAALHHQTRPGWHKPPPPAAGLPS